MNIAAPALSRHLARAYDRPVEIAALTPLTGGAVRRHFRIDARIAGAPQRFVLRTDGATPLGFGLALEQEFALLQHLSATGLAVAPPILWSDDAAVTGAPFHVTRWVEGSADPSALAAAAPHPALARQLGQELARLQAIRPPCSALAFLGALPDEPLSARLAWARHWLDRLGEARPAAEWAMRWLARQRIEPLSSVLCHGDFRTGNYLDAGGRLAALLDWEFAGWGDPDEDLGWFCSRCWRFGNDALEAGGIAPRAALYAGYAAASGRMPDPRRVRVWEVVAVLKWLVVALLQRDRFVRGGERSLDLALTGRRAAECEWELLRLVASSTVDARSA